MSRINVLWVIDHVCYDGSLHGGGRLFWNMLPKLQSDRVNVVACILRADEEIRELFADSPFPVRILDKSKFDPTTLWTFLKIIKQEKIDVLHLHCYASSTFGRIVGLIAGVPSIIHDYDTEVYFPYPSYLWLADRMLAPSTDGAMAASPMCKTFMMKHRRITEDRIRTMFHAIPAKKYLPVPEHRVNEAMDKLNISEDIPVIGTITKLGPQRGNEFLLQAFGEVVENMPNATLLLIYQVTYFHRLPSKEYVEISDVDKQKLVSELEDLSAELGITENVRFIPSLENIDALISVCDLLATPFQSERFSSVSLLEGMARGKPFVATRIGEQQEIIQDGRNGYLVSMDDPGEMANRIVGLLSDPAKLQQFSNAARSTAEKYSVDANVEALMKWYEELSEKNNQRLARRRGRNQ